MISRLNSSSVGFATYQLRQLTPVVLIQIITSSLVGELWCLVAGGTAEAAAWVPVAVAEHEASPSVNWTVTDGEHETRGEDGGAG